jgi:hypothetical protein
MDGYPMPIANLLVDATAGHQIISFMDGNVGYNQIFMAEEDIPKTAFICPGHVGLFEWRRKRDFEILRRNDTGFWMMKTQDQAVLTVQPVGAYAFQDSGWSNSPDFRITRPFSLT